MAAAVGHPDGARQSMRRVDAEVACAWATAAPASSAAHVAVAAMQTVPRTAFTSLPHRLTPDPRLMTLSSVPFIVVYEAPGGIDVD
jgi:hypothetical protein